MWTVFFIAAALLKPLAAIQVDIYKKIQFPFTLTISNMGPNDKLTYSSAGNSVTITNQTFFSQLMTAPLGWKVDVQKATGSQMQYATKSPMNAPEYFGISPAEGILYADYSTVLYFHNLVPGNPYSVQLSSGLSNQVCFAIAQDPSQPEDLLQWSNVWVIDAGKHYTFNGTAFEFNGKCFANRNELDLYVAQPVLAKGALIITPSLSSGATYATTKLDSQTFNFQGSFTVVGEPDGSTQIDVRTTDPSISVGEYGTNIRVPLNKSPMRLSGKMWTFFTTKANASVKFSAVEN